MKKMKLTRSLLAACSIVALTAVMYGCVHDGGDEEPMAEMPMPEPDPGPTDLDDTQAAAAAAATAAMAASTSAAMSASDAMAETMTLATLQTGADSNSGMMGGREHASAASYAAKDAADAAAAAAAASAAAAAATTGEAGEAAWRMAVEAQEEAEAAMASAATHSAAAIAAAEMELHINGTVKSAGDSSADANADTTISPTGDRVTGFIRNVSRDSDGVTGMPYIEATGQAYQQAVEARSLTIGKVVDTSDDMHRLTIIHSRATSEMHRVYAVSGLDNGDNDISVGASGVLIADTDSDPDTLEDNTYAPLKSLGMYIEAADIQSTVDPVADDSGTTEFDTNHVANDDYINNLDHGDEVAAETKPKELFSYVDAMGNEQHVVEVSRTIVGTTTTVTYRPVDTLAGAAPDIHDPGTGGEDAGTPDENPESIVVRANIPTATPYEHIHFGVWAGLAAGSTIADLGIGFVQNFSGSGMTDRLGIGTVTYNGNYLANVQRQNATAGTGAINLEEGDAVLTANFDDGEFTGDLMGLAMLEGTLDGNGFRGMTATVDMDHADLDPSGTFTGEFSGGIYGPAGTEAAGVFDFDGGEAGAFVGAFGGTNQD